MAASGLQSGAKPGTQTPDHPSPGAIHGRRTPYYCALWGSTVHRPPLFVRRSWLDPNTQQQAPCIQGGITPPLTNVAVWPPGCRASGLWLSQHPRTKEPGDMMNSTPLGIVRLEKFGINEANRPSKLATLPVAACTLASPMYLPIDTRQEEYGHGA